MCLNVRVGRGWMGSYRAGVAVVPLAGCRGHRPVGVGLQETTEFPGGSEGIARVDNRGRPWGLNWPPKQHYRGVSVGCNFTSCPGQESERPTGLNQIIGDLIEHCLLRSQVAHQMD